MAFYLLFVFCSNLLWYNVVYGQQQQHTGLFCWNGTLDERDGWRNESCVTGKSTIPGSFYETVRDISPNNSQTKPNITVTVSISKEPIKHCFIFEYFDESKFSESGEDVTVQTLNGLISCDFESLCHNKSVQNGHKLTYRGKNGTLYCCDVNNCNTEKMVQKATHKHTCYHANWWLKKYEGTETSCPDLNMPCLRTVLRQNSPDDNTVLEERFDCDIENECSKYNLTEAHNCTVLKNTTTGDEMEICCCWGDDCFKPVLMTPVFSMPSLSLNDLRCTNKYSPGCGINWQLIAVICVSIFGGLAFLCLILVILKKSLERRPFARRFGHYMMSYKRINKDNAQTDSDTLHILNT
ncbi:hypothetical protein ACJMK2_005495 [Sinanodonta woodiana]|uniref:Uncharacterized protein n=1 Tax=Sinanodonta woodiana TaxID=1069815 RepID=A0ABD3VT82_SINWO